jgi:hypothetical protein
MQSFWINFIDLGFKDPAAPYWAAYYWRAIGTGCLLVACLGLVLRLIKERTERRALLLSLLGLLAGIIVFCFGTSPFPIANGRYLHPLLPLVVIILFFGLSSLIRNPKILLSFLGAHFLMVQLLVGHYFLSRYPECRSDTRLGAPPGVLLTADNLDEEDGDELLFYHRAKNRAYIAKWENPNGITFNPEWTRVIGLPGDQLVFADVDGKPGADIVLRRPFFKQMFYIPGKEISSFNPSIYFQQDRATKLRLITDFSFEGELFGSFDGDGDGKSGIFIYDKHTGELRLRLGVLPLPNRVLSFTLPKKLENLVFFTKNGELFALTASGSELSLQLLQAGEASKPIWEKDLQTQILGLFYSHFHQSAVVVGDQKCLLVDPNGEQANTSLSCPNLSPPIFLQTQMSLVEKNKQDYLAYLNPQSGELSLWSILPETTKSQGTKKIQIHLNW